LQKTTIGIKYKSLFYDQVVDALLLLKTGLIFIAAILVSIQTPSYPNIMTNVGFGIAVSALAIQKWRKLIDFYWII
jgi:hypothetical protein